MSKDSNKKPFDIDLIMARLREAVVPYPKAAMFALANEGYKSVFEQLISCMISIRTRDETTIPCAHKLFALARTPAAMVKLSVDEIDAAIEQSTFHERKASQIQKIAEAALAQHDGELPCDYEILTSFAGVGPKCANLTLGVACNVPSISVDVHVHRVTNRWGYVETNSPVATMRALEKALPRDYWIEINSLLVPFGKHICTGSRPRCSSCSLLSMCRQRGVNAPR